MGPVLVGRTQDLGRTKDLGRTQERQHKRLNGPEPHGDENRKTERRNVCPENKGRNSIRF